MTLPVRAATPDDARGIAEVHVAGWRWAYRGQMPDALLDSLSVEDRAEKRRVWIEKPTSPENRRPAPFGSDPSGRSSVRAAAAMPLAVRSPRPRLRGKDYRLD